MSDLGPDGRRDLRRNRQQILVAAALILRSGRRLSAAEVATRAGVSRATVYRHFASMELLTAEASRIADDPSIDVARSSFDIHAVLEHVAPNQLAEIVVAEAARRVDDVPVALYLVDIDGSRLLRTTGVDAGALPDEIAIPQSAGPEVAVRRLEALQDAVAAVVPEAVVAPLVVRDSAFGVLVAANAVDPARLEPLARDAAVAVAIAERLTDEIPRARRRRDTTPAAEAQQTLLPARITHMTGLRFAGHVQPSYENGGNWFDHAQNDDGAWVAAIDTLGSGERAAAISAVVHGALRAARNAGSTPADALVAMHGAIGRIGLPDPVCDSWVARWHAPSSRLFWAASGDLVPWLVAPGRPRRVLDGPLGPALGSAAFGAPTTNHLRLTPGEVVLLLSDGAFGGESAPLAPRHIDAVLRRGAIDPVTLVTELLIMIAERDEELGDDAMVVAFGPPDER